MNDEYQLWGDAKYPYDGAECGACLSGHESDLCCTRKTHAPLREAARKAGLVKLVNRLRRISYRPGIEDIRKKFLKLRKKYRKFWSAK